MSENFLHSLHETHANNSISYVREDIPLGTRVYIGGVHYSYKTPRCLLDLNLFLKYITRKYTTVSVPGYCIYQSNDSRDKIFERSHYSEGNGHFQCQLPRWTGIFKISKNVNAHIKLA